MPRVGRPSALEVRRRSRVFVALLVAGVTPRRAADEAGLSPARALRLLDDPALWQALRRVREAA